LHWLGEAIFALSHRDWTSPVIVRILNQLFDSGHQDLEVALRQQVFPLFKGIIKVQQDLLGPTNFQNRKRLADMVNAPLGLLAVKHQKI
jgi:hypothetical protein